MGPALLEPQQTHTISTGRLVSLRGAVGDPEPNHSFSDIFAITSAAADQPVTHPAPLEDATPEPEDDLDAQGSAAPDSGALALLLVSPTLRHPLAFVLGQTGAHDSLRFAAAQGDPLEAARLAQDAPLPEPDILAAQSDGGGQALQWQTAAYPMHASNASADIYLFKQGSVPEPEQGGGTDMATEVTHPRHLALDELVGPVPGQSGAGLLSGSEPATPNHAAQSARAGAGPQWRPSGAEGARLQDGQDLTLSGLLSEIARGAGAQTAGHASRPGVFVKPVLGHASFFGATAPETQPWVEVGLATASLHEDGHLQIPDMPTDIAELASRPEAPATASLHAPSPALRPEFVTRLAAQTLFMLGQGVDGNGPAQLEIDLGSENLGRLVVQLHVMNAALHVQVLHGNLDAQALLRRALPSLVRALDTSDLAEVTLAFGQERITILGRLDQNRTFAGTAAQDLARGRLDRRL